MKHYRILILVLGLLSVYACEKEEAPESAFMAESSEVAVGEAVEFSITGSGEFWAFYPGDGSAGMNIEEDAFEYAYNTPGSYTASLIASNLYDDYSLVRDTATMEITVTDNEERTHTRFSSYKLDFRYNFEGFEDKRLKFKMDGIIEGNQISFEVPNSSILDEMRSIFSVPTTSKVYVGDVEQQSSVTRNDFNSPLEYRIVAADGTEEINTVTVTRLPKSSNAQLMSFDLTGMPAGITSTTVQEGSEVDVILSDSCDVTDLKAAFSIHDFARAYIDGVEQESEKTSADYSAQVTFNVVAEDKSSVDYYINTLFQPVLLRFYFAQGNPFAAEGSFNESADTLFVHTPPGSDLSALIASFEVRPYDCSLSLNGIPQVSGVTAADYSTPLSCKVSGAVDTEFTVVVE